MMTKPISETFDELPANATGTWRIYTRDSCHVLRLDERTVTREPGPNTDGMFNDTALPLRSIDTCRVGERGRWTMHTTSWSDTVDWYWANTSVVQRIVKDDEAGLTETDDEPER